MGSVASLDYSKFNKEVAKKRGDKWKNKLRENQANKVISNKNSTSIACLRVTHHPHLTQEFMAQRVGIKQPRYARIERGELFADHDIAFKIAGIFKKKINDVFVEVHPKKFLAI